MSSYERAKRWREGKEQREIAAARRLIEQGVPAQPLRHLYADSVDAFEVYPQLDPRDDVLVDKLRAQMAATRLRIQKEMIEALGPGYQVIYPTAPDE